PRIQAPIPAKPCAAISSSMPISPPALPCMCCHVRVGNNHSISATPPTPSGLSRSWLGPAPYPSIETAKLETRSFDTLRSPGSPRLRPRHQLPEERLADDGHAVPLGRQTPDLHQLEPAALAGNLLNIGPTPHQNIRRRSRVRLHQRTGAGRGGNRFAPGPLQETGKRHATPPEALHAAGVETRGTRPQSSDELARRLVALLPCAQATMNHFLQVVAAGKPSDVTAPHGAVHVTPEQHRDQLAHLIDVVALLPL